MFKINEKDNAPLVEISNLTKKYGRKAVLSGISLTIRRGDSLMFIGRNGCGKSTLLKIICGLLPFESGKVVHSHKLKFGYIPERFPPLALTAREYIKQIGSVEGLNLTESSRDSERLFKALFMKNMADTPIRYLSKGTMQKVAAVQALLIRPDILILDEPLSGQDMASQQVFLEMINNLRLEKQMTVVSSCHERHMISAIAKSVYEIVDVSVKFWGVFPEPSTAC